MNNDYLIKALESLEKDSVLQNLIAQANARYILYNTSEKPANFPSYTIQDEKLNLLAFQYLNIGCNLLGQQQGTRGIKALEKGASLLEYIHGSPEIKSELKSYYGLIAALSYYVCFQYSKSFILIGKIANETIVAQLISLFLNRKYSELLNLVNQIVVDKKYSDNSLAENFDKADSNRKIYELIIAKALNNFVKYFYSGNQQLLFTAKSLLQNLKEIAEIRSEPDIWWVIRLLLLITDGFTESSLWNSLGIYFNTKEGLAQKYIHSLTYKKPEGIYELFITQRNSLPKVINSENLGCIVSIPTSSGKTRIAEIAILDCLTKNENNKVLFIAPFRSLAYEIENSLDQVFYNVGISVSHLYGGNLFSKLDEKIIDESEVIVATPEKAKALLRGNSSVLKQIKLVIIDEGHLLGGNKRLIVNEMFYEELRYYIDKHNGRFLLLSAVLPNAEDLALWLTNSESTVFKQNWRPSDERLGILEWNRKTVSLNWESTDTERKSYNPRFIVSKKLPKKPRQRKIRHFPESKNQAIAATAYKLRKFGPVLIFVGLKASVFTMAREYLKCLNPSDSNFSYKNRNDWKAFELSCKESYGVDSEWFLFAQKGIICHHAGLVPDVRLPLERLMRKEKPLVIIATSTLGQGVNLGVSTVIFSTVYQAGQLISSRDFWNIAGRAGRAFVDHEGKILVALDTVGKKSIQIRDNRKLIRNFFDKDLIDKAKSGCLMLIKTLKSFALNYHISFDYLIQLIASNNISNFNEDLEQIDQLLDWIDDGLLALHRIHNGEDENNYNWIDNFFSTSLAFIQSHHYKGISGDEVIKFIKARTQGIIARVGNDRNKWNSIINSGIPLNSDLQIEEKLDQIVDVIQFYFLTGRTIDDKIDLLKLVENEIENINVLSEEYLKSSDRDLIRFNWLNAIPFSVISSLSYGVDIVTSYYSFSLPWVLNGIAKKLNLNSFFQEAEVVEELAILVELGLPNLKSVKIYQAGIRSRSCAKEISLFFEDELWEKNIKYYKHELVINSEFYKTTASEDAKTWIDLLSKFSKREISILKSVSNFNFEDVHEKTDRLLAREINGELYLMSPDFEFIYLVSETDVDFTSGINKDGVFFDYDKEYKVWRMNNLNPYLKFDT